MRRKSDKDIRKEYAIFLILGIICILFGLFMLSLPLMPSTSSEEYIEKEVIVSEIDHYYGGPKGSSYDYIITNDGEEYTITGEYSRSQLFEIFSEATPALIKYDVNKIFPFIKYAEEIIVNDIRVVKYNNDQPVSWTFPIIFFSIFCLLGVGFLFVYRSFIIRNRKMQAKRDARIAKKYHSLDK